MKKSVIVLLQVTFYKEDQDMRCQGSTLKENEFAKEYFRDLLEMKLNDFQFIESAQVIRFHRGKQ